MDMPPLLDEEEDTPPLVVGPPSCLSHIVMTGMMPTVIVSLAGVETLLSSSPRVNPRMSTSVARLLRGDMKSDLTKAIYLSECCIGQCRGWDEKK